MNISSVQSAASSLFTPDLRSKGPLKSSGDGFRSTRVSHNPNGRPKPPHTGVGGTDNGRPKPPQVDLNGSDNGRPKPPILNLLTASQPVAPSLGTFTSNDPGPVNAFKSGDLALNSRSTSSQSSRLSVASFGSSENTPLDLAA